MTIFLTVIHVLISLFIIGAVLLQAGKGAEVGLPLVVVAVVRCLAPVVVVPL